MASRPLTIKLELTEDEVSRLYSALKYREESDLVQRLEDAIVKLRRATPLAKDDVDEDAFADTAWRYRKRK